MYVNLLNHKNPHHKVLVHFGLFTFIGLVQFSLLQVLHIFSISVLVVFGSFQNMVFGLVHSLQVQFCNPVLISILHRIFKKECLYE